MRFYCLSMFYVYVFRDLGIYIFNYFVKFSIPNTTVINCYVMFSEKDAHALDLSVLN